MATGLIGTNQQAANNSDPYEGHLVDEAWKTVRDDEIQQGPRGRSGSAPREMQGVERYAQSRRFASDIAKRTV
jgi:hypothetical protein